MRIKEIAKRSKINDTSHTYRALRVLIKAGLLEKVERPELGLLQYKFIQHTPAHHSNGRPDTPNLADIDKLYRQ